MALREFTDRRGVEWKVWDITPERLHPSTRVGDYLQGFVDGWLVFETADGRDKRRLYPVPVNWEELTVEALDLLCERAESVKGGGGRPRPSSPREMVAEDAPHDPAVASERPAARTFLYPGGRVWTVAEQYIQLRNRMGEPLDARTVLRFTSGMRTLDLLAWPSDWASYSDDELSELLGRAFPRDREGSTDSAQRRRRSDQRV
jgi:hypothetical protein